MMGFGILTRYLHGAFCVQVKHIHRAQFFAVCTGVSYLILIACLMMKPSPNLFFVVLGASTMQGIANTFGESLFMGFLKGFPPQTIGYASAGTGLAGILATGTLLLTETIGLPKHYLFMIVLPTVVLYYQAFKWLVNQK